jgi:hypothetical protein
MRRLTVRAVVLISVLSIAAPIFASSSRDASGVDTFFGRLVRVVRHLLPLGDPIFPKP